ncbi:serine/threonine-protein kinase [Roseimaritima sediminicola]|uniref:serine/threonine-protein kinase n=1 Tax=Roseimaritima sediminicola TaxID=2662066 RepID=UPI0013875900|nr:serine/threonine-protein kinase [Roseimaritima sediminicola]
MSEKSQIHLDARGPEIGNSDQRRTTGGNFLATILDNPAVLEELEAVGSTRQTITIDATAAQLAPLPPVAGGFKETLEAPTAPGTASEPDSGPFPLPASVHLPLRPVVSQGQRSGPDSDYRLVGVLGHGGTAVVYQAHQRAVDREVAVKVLRDELAGDASAQQRFIAEAQTVGGLDHPNVIALHELAHTEDGRLFYSMKRIDGTSWAEVLAERSLEENLSTLLRVADAVRYAHSRGLLHRDIKPENVMLGRFGEVLVADWGLALSYSGPQTKEQTQSIGGTPAYMAPEQAAGSITDLGRHTDVYLLGAVLFQILTGEPPHHGETLVACIRAAAQNVIRPTRVTGELMDIARRAMQRRPSKRFESVDAFQQALRGFQDHQESVRLVDRARQCADKAAATEGYDKYGLAISLLNEALEVSPGNRRAQALLSSLRVEFARRAIDQGDYDLALSLLDSAGEGDSELAYRVRKRRSSRQQKVEREARLQMLFSHSADAVLLTRLDDGTILETNEVFLRRFGFQLDQIVGKRVIDLGLWVCQQRRAAFLEELQRRGRIDNFEARFYASDSRVIDVLISGRTMVQDGKRMLVTNLRDVTQRKLAEDELKRSRQRLREFTRLAGLGTWEFDVATQQVRWNSQLYTLTGVSRDEQAPSLEVFLETVHPQDRQRLQRQIEHAMQTGQPYEVQSRHRLPSGEYRTVISRGQPIRDDDGKVVEIYGTLHDITKQSTEVQRARAQTNAMQQLIDCSPELLCAVDPDGTVLAASGALARQLETTAEQLCSGWRFETQQPYDHDASSPQDVQGRLRHPQRPAMAWQSIRLHPTDDPSTHIARWDAAAAAP